jgi:hypothetical protein
LASAIVRGAPRSQREIDMRHHGWRSREHLGDEIFIRCHRRAAMPSDRFIALRAAANGVRVAASTRHASTPYGRSLGGELDATLLSTRNVRDSRWCGPPVARSATRNQEARTAVSAAAGATVSRHARPLSVLALHGEFIGEPQRLL